MIPRCLVSQSVRGMELALTETEKIAAGVKELQRSVKNSVFEHINAEMLLDIHIEMWSC